MEMVYNRLTLDKNYTKNYTDKSASLLQVNQQQQYMQKADKHDGSRDSVLDKVKTQTLYFKNVSLTFVLDYKKARVIA